MGFLLAGAKLKKETSSNTKNITKMWFLSPTFHDGFIKSGVV
jgi:hypothetical protein